MQSIPDEQARPSPPMPKAPFRRIPWVLLGGIVLTIGLGWAFLPRDPDNAPGAPSMVEGPNISNENPGSRVPVAKAEAKTENAPQFPPRFRDWPETSFDGKPAKEFLLETLNLLNESFSKIPTYSATFRKQERIQGKLLDEQSFAMKVRQTPFAVYFKAMVPKSGKEVIFAKGLFDDKVIAHSEGLSRLLVPRLQVPPEHPLIRSESRHPITNAGIGNLIRNLIEYREKDLEEPEAEISLDRWTDQDGRNWLRSVHVHHQHSADRPFKRVIVLYDPETRLPLRFTGYDWPDPNKTGPKDSPVLGEFYAYDDLTLNAPLNALDFDPENPAYHFRRF